MIDETNTDKRCKHFFVGISATIFPAHALEKLFCKYCQHMIFQVIEFPIPPTLNFEVGMDTINVREVLPWQEWLVRKKDIRAAEQESTLHQMKEE